MSPCTSSTIDQSPPPSSSKPALHDGAIETLPTRGSRWVAILGLSLGLALTIWTWARAASMSADGAHYMELAERSWRLGPNAGMDWYSGPGYPVITGWVFGLTGDLDFSGRMTSFLFGLATLVGVWTLSRRMFGYGVAGIAVGLLAVHTTFVRHTVMAETDAAYGCCIVWATLFTWKLKHADALGRQALWAVLAGVALGIGYLTRPEAIPLAGLLALWYLFGGIGRQSAECGIRNAESELLTSISQSAHPLTLSPPHPITLLPPYPLNLVLLSRDLLSSCAQFCRVGQGRLSGRRPTKAARIGGPALAARASPTLRWVVGAARVVQPRARLPRRILWTAVAVASFVPIAAPYLLKLHDELGRWSLSGKERSIVLKFVPDKVNFEEVLKRGISGAILYKPSNLLRWLPYHVHWGLPQFVKALHPVVLVLAIVGVFRRRFVWRTRGAVGLLLWSSVPFIFFFFLTFPGRRYFMQAMPQWTILAAVGTIELAGAIALGRSRISMALATIDPQVAFRRAWNVALATPMLLMAASTWWGNRKPIEQSLATERAIGERIFQLAGPGHRVLSFTVTAFYSRGLRVPLWGPMEGIVRCHGYGKPLSYEDFLAYVRRHGAEFVVLDDDLRHDCPEFLDRVRPEDFELVVDDIQDNHGPCPVYRTVGRTAAELRAN